MSSTTQATGHSFQWGACFWPPLMHTVLPSACKRPKSWKITPRKNASFFRYDTCYCTRSHSHKCSCSSSSNLLTSRSTSELPPRIQVGPVWVQKREWRTNLEDKSQVRYWLQGGCLAGLPAFIATWLWKSRHDLHQDLFQGGFDRLVLFVQVGPVLLRSFGCFCCMAPAIFSSNAIRTRWQKWHLWSLRSPQRVEVSQCYVQGSTSRLAFLAIFVTYAYCWALRVFEAGHNHQQVTENHYRSNISIYF